MDIKIETKRLSLRLLTENDLDNLQKYHFISYKFAKDNIYNCP